MLTTGKRNKEDKAMRTLMQSVSTFLVYRADMVIRNLDQLPRGTGAKYLEVLVAHNGDLVAVCWRNNAIQQIGHQLIRFPN